MFFPATPRLTVDRRGDWRQFWPADAMLFARARFALFGALLALRRAAGVRRLWIPAYLCCPVPEAARAAGLAPVHYDIDERLAPRLHTVRPRPGDALLVVHYFGLLAPLAPLRAFSADAGMPLVEDCAHALPDPSGPGAGSVGQAAVFSLRKLGPLPGGGLLVVRDPRLSPHVTPPAPRALPDPRTLGRLTIMVAERAAETLGVNPLRVKDRLPVLDASPGDHEEPAGGRDAEYVAPPAPARLLDRMLRGADWNGVAARRRAAYRQLVERLAGAGKATLPVPQPAAGSVPEALPVFVDDPRDAVQRLRRRGVEASDWPGAEQFPFDPRRFPGAAAWRARSLCLPVGTSLTPARVDRLAETIVDALRDRARAAGVPVPGRSA